MKITVIDIIIILITGILIFSAAFYNAVPGNSEISKFVLIKADDFEQKLPLNSDTEIIVSGKLGDSIIRIENNRAFFVKSPCQNQLCVRMPKLAYISNTAACLPNGIILKIIDETETENSREIDAVAK